MSLMPGMGSDPSGLQIDSARGYAADGVHPELAALFAVRPRMAGEFRQVVTADRQRYSSSNERRAVGFRLAATGLMGFTLVMMMIVGGTESGDDPLFFGAGVVGVGVLTLWCCEATRIPAEQVTLGGRIAIGVDLGLISAAVLAMASGAQRLGWGPLRAGGAIALGIAALALSLLWLVVHRRGSMRGELPLPRRGRPLTPAVSHWCADRRASLTANERGHTIALQAMVLGISRQKVREDLELADWARRNWLGPAPAGPELSRRRRLVRSTLIGGAFLALLASPFFVNPFLGRMLIALLDVPGCGGEQARLDRWIVAGALVIPSALAVILAFRLARWRLPQGWLAAVAGWGVVWLIVSWTQSLFGGRFKNISESDLARQWGIDSCQGDFLRSATEGAAVAGATMLFTLFALMFMAGRVRRSYCTAFAAVGSTVAGALFVVLGAG